MDDEKPVARCGNCLAFEAPQDAKNPQGLCKRGPPLPLVIPTRVVQPGGRDFQLVSAWPPTPESGYCMAFLPNVALQESMRQMQEPVTKQ